MRQEGAGGKIQLHALPRSRGTGEGKRRDPGNEVVRHARDWTSALFFFSFL